MIGIGFGISDGVRRNKTGAFDIGLDFVYSNETF